MFSGNAIASSVIPPSTSVPTFFRVTPAAVSSAQSCDRHRRPGEDSRHGAQTPAPVIGPPTPKHLTTLPFDDTADFDDTDRGFIAALQPCVVTAADGRVVWDNDVYDFWPVTHHLGASQPVAAVHPWPRSRASTRWSKASTRCADWTCQHQLHRGDTGVIVIDPLICTETAAAALALYRAHRRGGR